MGAFTESRTNHMDILKSKERDNSREVWQVEGSGKLGFILTFIAVLPTGIWGKYL